MDKVKSKVLKELMAAMDEQDGERLKMHPKLVAAKLTIAKPIAKDEVKEEPSEEMMDEEDMSGMEGEMDGMEDLTELDSLSPEMKAKIIKMLSK